MVTPRRIFSDEQAEALGRAYHFLLGLPDEEFLQPAERRRLTSE
jgi:hypothetical protein